MIESARVEASLHGYLLRSIEARGPWEARFRFCGETGLPPSQVEVEHDIYSGSRYVCCWRDKEREDLKAAQGFPVPTRWMHMPELGRSYGFPSEKVVETVRTAYERSPLRHAVVAEDVRTEIDRSHWEAFRRSALPSPEEFRQQYLGMWERDTSEENSR